MKARTFLATSFAMALGLILLNCLVIGIVYYLSNGAYLSIALIATAVTTFASLIVLCQNDPLNWVLSEQIMRTAISGTIVLVYLVLISFATFNFLPDQQSSLTGTLITNFSSIVGVVIASYFGASAYVQARNSRAESDTAQPSANRPSPREGA